MKEVLLKLNKVNTHNKIERLKKENEIKDKKMQELADGCKEIIVEYKENSEKIIESMNEKINKLEEEKIKLEKENAYYKDTVEKIPKVLLKIFCKKSKKCLNEGE